MPSASAARREELCTPAPLPGSILPIAQPPTWSKCHPTRPLQVLHHPLVKARHGVGRHGELLPLLQPPQVLGEPQPPAGGAPGGHFTPPGLQQRTRPAVRPRRHDQGGPAGGYPPELSGRLISPAGSLQQFIRLCSNAPRSVILRIIPNTFNDKHNAGSLPAPQQSS